MVKYIEAVFTAAIESIFGAFAVMLFLVIAQWIAVEVLGSMIPVFPEVLSSTPESTQASIEIPSRFQQIVFYIVHYIKENFYFCSYVTSFAFLSVYYCAHVSGDGNGNRLSNWLERMYEKVTEDWFETFFGNAIEAIIAAFILTIISGFSFTAIFINWLLELLQPHIFAIISAESISTVEGLQTWYHANEMKIFFWPIYVSLVLDDLGFPVPSLNSVFNKVRRWFKRTWKRLQNR